MLYLSIILATLCIQVPNVWAIRFFEQSPGLPAAFWIAAACIPTSFLSTAFFAFYYGKGHQTLSYPAMAVMAYGVSMVTSFLIHFLILRARPFAASEIAGAMLILAGIGIIIAFRK